MEKSQEKLIEKVLRIGVAFSFIYPPISAFFNPYAWVGYFPALLTNLSFIDSLTLLHIFGVIELCIGIWILFGKRIFIPSLLASTLLFAIIVLNLKQIDVLFRDIPILLMALLLCIIDSQRNGLH
jgi:hypothetical protein